MKKEKRVTCFVLMDFAGLKKKELNKVYADLKKKYPENLVLPMDEEAAVVFDKEIDYFVCTIEKIIATKPTVAVQYRLKSGQIRNLVETII